MNDVFEKYYKESLTPEDKKCIFYEMDRNSNGKIEYAELILCLF